jgi:hypothetical protein
MANLHPVRTRNRVNIGDAVAEGKGVDMNRSGLSAMWDVAGRRRLTDPKTASQYTRLAGPSTRPVRCASALAARRRIRLLSAMHRESVSELTGGRLPYRSGVVCRPSNEEFAIRRPGEVVDVFCGHPGVSWRVKPACGLAHCNIFCNLQCSLSGRSSPDDSPKVACGRSEGTQRITFPSARQLMTQLGKEGPAYRRQLRQVSAHSG